MPLENYPSPVLALLIPHYNQREALKRSLASVTFANELIIVLVDDGSSIKERLDSHWIDGLELDFPVHLISLQENRGITHALNAGLKFIIECYPCTYIARLDCGDYNQMGRLDKQYAFLEAHPSIALCGTWCRIIDNDNRALYTLETPLSHNVIKRKMLSDNCFVHPSVMFRTDAVRTIGYYPEHYPAAEDYAYFSAFVSRFRTANLAEVLVEKMRNASSISYRHRRQQLVSRLRIIINNFTFHYQSFWGVFKALVFLVLPVSWVERLKQRLLS